MNDSRDKRIVLILIPNFLPGYKLGGPLTSIINMVENLSSEFLFEILTSDRDKGDKDPYHNIKFNIWLKKDCYNICYTTSNFITPYRLIKSINSSNADILYLNSLFNPLFSIFILFVYKIGFLKNKKIILAPRGETYDEALNFKKNKKKYYLWLAEKINLYKSIFWHASTEFEKKSIVKNLRVMPESIHIALNLAQKIQPNINDIDLSTVHTIKNTLQLVFLSRISKDKNIIYTFDVLKNIKTDIIFHIYGPVEDNDIWEICKQKISNLPANIKVEYKGIVAKTDVKKIFLKYDLMFLPTFAENFGHVIVEALSVGTPVLLSDNTPWRNLKKQAFGWDLPLNKPQMFVHAIESMANLPDKIKNENRINLIKNFAALLDNPETLNANKKLFQ